MGNVRRRVDNLVLIHSNVAALPVPSGAGTPFSEKMRAPDGTGPRWIEIRVVAKAAGPAVIPGPVFLMGNEDALAGQASATDEWNQIGAALNAGAGLSVTNKKAYSEIRELVGGYRALALYNSGAAISGANVDVQIIPLDVSYV